MIRTGITVDWDYFVPEDPMWDIQHAETRMHLDMIWQTRSFLVDKIKTTGEEEGFWDWLRDAAGIYESILDVSESHVHVMKTLLHSTKRIISFDQHHDCWDCDDEERVMCHNWGDWWLDDDKERELIWVYPEHVDIDNFPEARNKRMKAVPRKEFDQERYFGDAEITFLHACRSGCWTAPWLDKQFIDFIELSGFDVNDLEGDKDWSPMKQRWEDIPGMMENLRQQQVLIEELKKGHLKNLSKIQLKN